MAINSISKYLDDHRKLCATGRAHKQWTKSYRHLTGIQKIKGSIDPQLLFNSSIFIKINPKTRHPPKLPVNLSRKLIAPFCAVKSVYYIW